MPGPHVKRIKAMDSIKKEEEADRLSDRLPWDDLLPQILSFVGDRQYRFVGAVNHSFHDAYVELFPDKETDVNVSSTALAELCMKDCAEKWDAFYKTPVTLEDDEEQSDLDGSYIASSLLHTATIYNFEILQYLRSLTFDSKFKEKAWSSNYISMYAASNGHLHIVQWLHEQDILSGSETLNEAARIGNLEVLQWCHRNGFGWDEETFGAAADGGHWPVLNYLYDNGCPWDSFACASAALVGNLEVLKWLRSKGCPWNAQTPSCAVCFGHLHVLQWAYYNDCPVDYDTCINAYRCDQWEIFDWALDNGLPMDREFFAWYFEDEDMVDDEESEMDISDYAFFLWNNDINVQRYDCYDESEMDDSGDDESCVCPRCQALLSNEEREAVVTEE